MRKFPGANVSISRDIPYRPSVTGDPYTKTLIKERDNVFRRIQDLNLVHKFFIEKGVNWENIDEGYFLLNLLFDALESKHIEKMARIIKTMGLV